MMSNPLDFTDIKFDKGAWVFLDKHDVERRARLYAAQNDLNFNRRKDVTRAFSVIYDAFDRYKERVLRERHEEEKAKNSHGC